MLSSLVIRKFRALEEFQVDKLGQVNLIVGKNNSGKSSVLEAISIYAGNGNRELLEDIAQRHDEKYILDSNDLATFDNAFPFEDFFTGRRFPDDDSSIQIGDIHDPSKVLDIRSVYLFEKEVIVEDDAGEERSIIRRLPISKKSKPDEIEVVGEALLVSKDQKSILIDFDKGRSRLRPYSSDDKKIPFSLIPTQFISMDELAKEWDFIALTEGEEIVKTALKIILPEFERLTFIDTENNDKYSRKRRRLAKVKISNLPRPVSLSSLGDGMLRVLQLVLKAFAAKGGFLLIDEFENGLHYSVQEKVWSLLFDISKTLGIQIFATTHSWDCIESFAKVAVEKQDVEGLLFRVGQSVRNSDKGRVIATIFEKEQLFSITQSDVEVR